MQQHFSEDDCQVAVNSLCSNQLARVILAVFDEVFGDIGHADRDALNFQDVHDEGGHLMQLLETITLESDTTDEDNTEDSPISSYPSTEHSSSYMSN